MGKENFRIQLDAECITNPLDIHEETFTLRQLKEGYYDNSKKLSGEVVAMAGKLNVRPKFQRAYVVEADKVWKAKLINSVLNHRPIGLIYFGVVKDKKSPYLYINIDGQQRIITICDFIQDVGGTAMPFTIKGVSDTLFFKELPQSYQDRILDYPLKVQICEGSEEEIYEWFETINQKATILVQQELRNVAYGGQWLEDAKFYFSATRSSDQKEINDKKSRYYAPLYKSNIDPVRQECLEMALDWVSFKDAYDDALLENPETPKEKIAEEIEKKASEDARIRLYMLNHKDDEDASELISSYKERIDWIHDVFFHNGVYSPQTIKSQPWGRIYAMYSDMNLSEDDKSRISERCKVICGGGSELYNKSTGVYEWVLRGERDDEIKTYLQYRGFEEKDRRNMWAQQGHRDPIDGKEYPFEEMDGHHIISWKDGGPTDTGNLVMLSRENHQKLHRGYYGITPSELRVKRDDFIKEFYSKK